MALPGDYKPPAGAHVGVQNQCDPMMMMCVVPTGANGTEEASSALFIKSGIAMTIVSGGASRSILLRSLRSH